MDLGGARHLLVRARNVCFANLGLKLIALIIAGIIYILVHRPFAEPAEGAPLSSEPPPTCTPAR